MGAAEKLCDYKTLSIFSPINLLDTDKLHELAQNSALRQYKSGERIFKLQSETHHRFYLVSGTLQLIENGKKTVLKADTKEAQSPLNALNSKQAQISAKTAVSILVVNNDLLDLLLNWDSSNSGYEVDEINSEQDGDWAHAILQNQTLLQLSPNNIQAIMACIEPINVKAGQIIIKQGGQDEYYYIISKGKCHVTHKKTARSKTKLLAELHEGDAFGEEALLAETKRNATITMVEDGLLLRLSRDDFSQFLKNKMIQYVSLEKANTLLEKGAQWIDIRSTEEHVKNGIGLNMPLSSARIMSQELSESRPYILYCENGTKSSTAAFLLRQRGLDVCVLQGGIQNNPQLDNNNITQKNGANLYYLNPENNGDTPSSKEKELTVKVSQLEKELRTLKNNSQKAQDKINLTHTKEVEALHANHKEELAQYVKLNKELKTQFTQQKSHNSTLEKILAGSEKQVKTLEKSLDASQQEKQKLDKKLETEVQKFSTLNKMLQEKEETFNDELNTSTQLINKLNTQLAEQEANNKELRRNHIEAQNQLTQEKGLTADLNKQLDINQDNVQALSDEKAIFEEKITSQEGIIKDLNEKIELHRSAMDDSGELTEELKSEISKAKQTITFKDEEINQYQTDIQNLDKELDALKAQLENTYTDIKQEQNQHTELENTIHQLQEKLSEQLSQQDALQKECDTLKSTISSLETKLDSAQEHHTKEKQEIVTQLEHEKSLHSKQQNLSSQLQEQNNQLNADLNELSQEKEAAHALIKDLKETSTKQQKTLDKQLDNIKSKAQDKLTQLQEQNTLLNQKTAELEERIAKTEQSLSEAEQRASLAEQTAEVLEFQLNRQQSLSNE